MEQFKKKYNTGLGSFSIILLVIASALFIFALFAPALFTMPTQDGKGFSNTGQIGDTIGGLMSPFINLSAVIVTGLAFYMQYTANKLQVQIFTDQLTETQNQFRLEQSALETQHQIQQFESQFFEMLRLHKENVNELKIKCIANGQMFEKRMAFESMVGDFNMLLSYAVFGNMPMMPVEYEVAYHVFFWGFSDEQIDKLSAPAAGFIRGEGVISNAPLPDFRSHAGYSSFLGHYFRHLFMMVKFVVESKVVNDYEEKMTYLKMLRAQLSNHEQIMLFYNWLSGYGDAWENNENQFFTEYKMIHNLWISELYQNQYIVNAVNGLIEKYNLQTNAKPLFEFQASNFNLKMKNIETTSLSDLL